MTDMSAKGKPCDQTCGACILYEGSWVRTTGLGKFTERY